MHDIAVPTLQLSGLIDLEEHLKCNRYTVNLVAVREALSLYIPNQEAQPQLEKFLIDSIQLEKFLIDRQEAVRELKKQFPELRKALTEDSQLEIFLINKKFFVSQLEKVLIRNRNFSNCPRGRKPGSKEAREGKNQNTENKRYIRDITLENNSVLSSDENTPSHNLPNLDESFSENARNPGGNNTSTTPAGNSTAAEGGNSLSVADAPTDQNTLPVPLINATDGLVQDSPTMPRSETTPSESQCSATESTSSTQPVKDLSNQATEQGKQASGDDPIATKTIENPPSQQALIEKPKQPQMPPASMKWCAEKLVQITEARRYCDNKQGAYFSEQLQGKSKKTQRQRQLEAARKIIALDIAEDRYLKAYDDRNDDWWNETKGSLTVESMIANNKEGVPRILAVLEKLESRGSTKRQKNNVTPMRPTNNPPIQQEPTAEKAAKIDAIQERLAKMQQPKQAVI